MSWPFENPIAETATELLRSVGFRIGTAELPELEPLAVAEDRYSIVGLLVGTDWAEIEGRLSELPIAFSNWAAEHGAGERQWDLYLVVLLATRIGEAELAQVEKFVGDIRFVRRIVRASVSGSRDAVRAALAPFLPVDIGPDITEGSPLDELEAKVQRAGLDEAVVAGAFDSFRATGEVDIP